MSPTTASSPATNSATPPAAFAAHRWTCPAPGYFPNVPRPDGSLTIATIGTEVAFDGDALASRYGDADGYRKQFEARLDELVADGWLLPEDEAYMRDDFDKVADF